MPLLGSIVLYLLAFVLVWVGAGLIVGAVTKYAHRLRLSTFSISFFVLGLLTSIPEMVVGIDSVLSNKQEVFVGTLLGGVIAMFVLVIPLLAFIGNGAELKHEIENDHILVLLLVVLAPAFLLTDARLSIYEGVFLVLSYLTIFFLIERRKSVLGRVVGMVSFKKTSLVKDLAKLIFGISLVLVSSHVLVDRTVYFSQLLSLRPFVVSLLVLSIGTNIPELSLAIKSTISGNKGVAFGDYLGSAAANTLIMGLLVIINYLVYRNGVAIPNHFFQHFIFILISISAFYLLLKSGRKITRKESVVLLVIYIGFLVNELSIYMFR